MRLLAIVLMIMTPLMANAAQRIERVALVMGVSDYTTIVPLDNTVNDARGISETLEGIGFQVTTLLNGSASEMRQAVDDFAFRSETADIALIYFAGHGVEVQGENFLIPADADVRSNQDIQRQAVSLKQLLASVENTRKMRVVILDSCRDNPFGDALDLTALAQTKASAEATRSLGSTGLAAPSPDRGTLVAFAAKDGAKALDGAGDNSPFALALMENLKKPGLEISLMFRQVRDQVLKTTGNQQEPFTYGSLSGTPFYVAGSKVSDAVAVAQTDAAPEAVKNEDPRVAWASLGIDKEAQLRALADQGDTRSMIGLAYMRLNPNDKRYAPGDASGLFQKAAEGGDAEAIFELAQLYEIGLGVEQDLQRALSLYEQAGEMDYPDALNDLGFLYFEGGLNLTKDPQVALNFFKRAADLRQPQALFNMAALIDDELFPGLGPEDAAGYLYDALRSGSEAVFEEVRDRPDTFKLETRKALQRKLAQVGFYASTIDGDFGPGTQRGVRLAYGLVE